MKLICETLEDTTKTLVEETNGKKEFFIEGVFMQGGIPNRNRRVYPNEILQSETARYIKENITKNRAYGELGHPQGPTINLERASHMIKELRLSGNDFVGRAKIMDTPFGLIVQNLISEGCSLGVSSRGVGTLKPNRDGINEVQSDFRLSTAADIVADPSAPSAFVNGIMEGVEWIYENGVLRSQEVEAMREDIRRTPRKELESKTLAIFESFLHEISTR